MKRFARVAAFGALGVAVGCVALYLLVAWGSSQPAAGGIDSTHATVAMISAGVPLAAVLAVHVVYARQLLRYAKENG